MAGQKRKLSPAASDNVYKKSRGFGTTDARCDPNSGQYSALPVGDDGDDGEDVDPEVVKYLQSVRQEASAIPSLLVAPKQSVDGINRDLYENGVGDFRGKYVDGAYLAAADTSSERDDSIAVDGIQQQYQLDAILRRYHDLRTQLAEIPPNDIVQRLGSDYPTQVGQLNKNLTHWWMKSMQNRIPKPAQVACMNKGSVLRLMRLLAQGSLLKRGLEVQSTTSYWVWSLLAKLPERGQLTSEEIGLVRELGKKAVAIGMSLGQSQAHLDEAMEDDMEDFDEDEPQCDLEDKTLSPDHNFSSNTDKQAEISERDASIASKDGPPEDLGQDETANQPVSADSQPPIADIESTTGEQNENKCKEEGEVDEDSEALAAMKSRMLNTLSNVDEQIDTSQDPHKTSIFDNSTLEMVSKATVDMIVTVAGEVYGQRDLLESIKLWAHVM